jgi:hypothetical protein
MKFQLRLEKIVLQIVGEKINLFQANVNLMLIAAELAADFGAECLQFCGGEALPFPIRSFRGDFGVLHGAGCVAAFREFRRSLLFRYSIPQAVQPGEEC